MEKIKELRDKAAKLKADIDTLAETAESWSDVDAQKFEELVASFEATQQEIHELEAKVLENIQKRDQALKKVETAVSATASPFGTLDGNAPTGFRIPANVKRSGSLKNFAGTKNGMDAEQRAYRFGQWCLAKITADLPGKFNFYDSVRFCQNYLGCSFGPLVDFSTGFRNAAMGEGAGDSSGGQYLVPEEFGMDMIDLRERYGVARRLFKMRSMSSDTRTDPRRSGGLTAYFVAENSAGTESNKSWDQVRLTAKDLMVISRYSSQLNADSVIAIGDDLAGEIAYAFSEKEDQCAFNGDGTSTYGGIVGVRKSLQDSAGTPTTTSAGGVVVGTGNAYSELTLDDFLGVVAVLPQYADTPNAAWVCHKSFFHNVMLNLELSAGGVPAREIMEGDRRGRPIFLGYPVEFSQVFPTTAANSQLCATLGDYSLGASFGDRQMTSIAFSEHATVGGESLWERNQIGIRGTQRFDINVHDTGSSTVAGPIVGLQTLNS